MSSRAFRKLQGRDKELQMLASFGAEAETSSDEGEEKIIVAKPSKNAFALVSSIDNS